ncbi:hypothetical protein QBC44DRAFT_365379 [Cladorrhinum sp. PSN332]|nr:hypothetical protein QBC44DRAFT_365379 [Cladorrhinum sp. PSN332]
MPRRHRKPDLPEPPAKRLRQTKSRMEYVFRYGSEAPSVVSSHLPSPELTGSSSNHDDAPSPHQIAQPAQPKNHPRTSAKPIQKRLPPAQKTKTRQKAPTAIAKPKPAPKAARVPDIYDRVRQATSQRRLQHSHEEKTASVPVEEDEFDPAVLKRDLTRHFINRAGTLHQHATQSLNQVHENLLKVLKQWINKDKRIFRSKIMPLCRPIESLKIRYLVQTSDGAETRAETVGELTARADKSHQEFLNKIENLWNDLTKMGFEMEEAICGTREVEEASSSAVDIMGEEHEEADKTALEEEIAEAEQEIELILEAAIGCARVIEKEHQKATLPDLHRYYRSINMF